MTNSQTTAYVYGTTSTSGVFSNDVVSKVEYPDLSTGAASTAAANDESYTYNALGQKTTMLDRNGTTHDYGFDVLGRLTSDVVPTGGLGSGVSNQTLALGYTYNDAGLPFKQTSLTNWDQSAVENQVQDVYNGYGQLIKQYQESGGSVNTSTSDDVQYGYSQPTGANYSRLASMTYPNGRVEDYGYNTGIDTTISRISYIADDAGSSAGHVAEYTYLGLSTIVAENEPEAGVELTYVQVPGDTAYNSDGGDRYTGLDRFGRVIDQAYYVTASPPSTPAFTDRLQYGHDRDGNVLYAKNLVNGSFSELYHANSASSGDNNTAYDPLSRITAFRRGTLTSSGNNGSTLDTITSANLNSTTSVPNTNSWSLDALGNWSSGNGSTNTFNSQNEETANGSHTLAYDNAGQMTTDEQGNTYVWDGWGHVVQVKNSGGSTLEMFKYDALGRNDQANNGSGFENVDYDAAGQQIQAAFANTYSQNVWGLAYVNDIILRDRNADGSMSTGNLGFTGSGLEEREYVQHDAQFSVISITNRTGSVIQRIAYDPYGTATLLTPSWAYDTSLGGTNWWTTYFQGMTLVADGAGNLEQSDTRLYNLTLGRWISQDRGYLDGDNLQEAFRSNPTVLVDPTGATARTSTQDAHLKATDDYISKNPCAVVLYAHYAFNNPRLGYHLALQVNTKNKLYRIELLGGTPDQQYNPKNAQIGTGPIGLLGIPSGASSESAVPVTNATAPGVEGNPVAAYGTYVVPNGDTEFDWAKEKDPAMDGTPIKPPSGICPCQFANEMLAMAVLVATDWKRRQTPYDGIHINSNTFIGNIILPGGGTIQFPSVPGRSIGFYSN